MPNLKEIRKRISTVKNTQKITSAMKMVSSAKLRRAQRSIIEARPYAQKLHYILSSLALRTELAAHPLLERFEVPRRAVLIVLSSDKGLCGAFNSALLRAAERFLRENANKYPEGISVAVCGKKGRDYFRRRKHSIYFEKIDVLGNPTVQTAEEIAAPLIKDYAENDLDDIYILFNEFRSLMSQVPTLMHLLPIDPLPPDPQWAAIDFIYEPSKEDLLSHMLPLYMEIEIYRAILESAASEFASRRNAMDSASRNCSELISKLTLEFNRARQAAITKELVEIVSGAEALKG